MKRTLTILLALSLGAFLLTACSKGSTAAVSLYDLGKAMTSAGALEGEMKYISSDDENAAELFSNVSSLDYGSVDGYFVYYAADGKGNADEIAVIRMKNSGDVTKAEVSLNEHLEKRKALYATYDKSQLSKLNGAKVVTRGAYAALIVADGAEAIENAFYGFFDN